MPKILPLALLTLLAVFSLQAQQPTKSEPQAKPAVPFSLGQTLTIEEDDPSMGKADAQVVIIEFSDFECGYCGHFYRTTFPKLKEFYIDTGRVRFIAKDFPLGFHSSARKAAVTANCALQHGDYWLARERLFQNLRRLGQPGLLEKIAVAADVTPDQLSACMGDHAMQEEIRKDIATGRFNDVRGTPTFFIGKQVDGKIVGLRRLAGAQPLGRFTAAIFAAEKL